MRRKFLVKPALQLRHLALTLGVVLIAFATCYLLFEHEASHTLTRNMMEQSTWAALRTHLRLGFGIGLLVLLIGVGFENYFFFHTVAGPIFALEKGMKRLAAGDFENVVHIREYDQLTDVIQQFEEMKKKISLRIEAHEKVAQLLTQELERLLGNTSQENIEKLKKRLQEIRDTVEKQAA